ncbi:hypothetical protein LQZ19_05260 [Treponema primitia]|uniref:hypothetical protein n=1 Tax=Treponema primitia TaxID=88058 RepID=UPI003980DD26
MTKKEDLNAETQAIVAAITFAGFLARNRDLPTDCALNAAMGTSILMDALEDPESFRDGLNKEHTKRKEVLNKSFRIDREDPEGRFLLEAVIELEDYADIAARPASASREQLEAMAGCYMRVFHDLREVLGLDD